MTKRHFEAIAAALKGSKPAYSGTPGDPTHVLLTQWRADVRSIADKLISSSAHSLASRFYAACGYETTEPEAKAEAKELKS